MLLLSRKAVCDHPQLLLEFPPLSPPPPPPPPPHPFPCISLPPPLSLSLPIVTVVQGVITATFLSLFFLLNHFHLLKQSSFCSLPRSQLPPTGILDAAGSPLQIPEQDPVPGSLDLAGLEGGLLHSTSQSVLGSLCWGMGQFCL